MQSIQILDNVSFGTLLDNSDGTITYTSNDSDELIDSFSYTVSDEFGQVSNIANVLITKTVVNTGNFPIEYNFNEGLPSEADGWTFYTSNLGQGRIQVLDGGLRMDVTTNNNFSLNEAILNVDLAGAREVELSFFQSDHGDELTQMPEEFLDHHNSDGVAISVDGSNWYRVLESADLDVTATGQTYNIDLSLLEQQIKAQHNSNFSFSANTQIKFQQYDNYSFPTDGRVWDDVKVEAVISDFSITSERTIEVLIPQGATSLAGCEVIQFENTGDSSLNWFLTLSDSWLSSDLNQGEILANSSASIDVCWDANSLVEGSTQQGLITLSDGNSGEAQEVSISVSRLSSGCLLYTSPSPRDS